MVDALAECLGVGADRGGDIDTKFAGEEEVGFGEEVVVAHGGVFALELVFEVVELGGELDAAVANGAIGGVRGEGREQGRELLDDGGFPVDEGSIWEC